MMLECASAHVGSSKCATSFVEEESNSNHPSLMFNDLLCMSAAVEEGSSTSNTTSDEASLTLYFAEPTELDKYAYFVFSSDFLEPTRYKFKFKMRIGLKHLSSRSCVNYLDCLPHDFVTLSEQTAFIPCAYDESYKINSSPSKPVCECI